jgi:hypothetical protein
VSVTILANPPGPAENRYSIKEGLRLRVPEPDLLLNDKCGKLLIRCADRVFDFGHANFPLRDLTVNELGGFELETRLGEGGSTKTFDYRALDLKNVRSRPVPVHVRVLDDEPPVARPESFYVESRKRVCGLAVLPNDYDPDDPQPTRAYLRKTSFNRSEIDWNNNGGRFCFQGGFQDVGKVRWFRYVAVDPSGATSNVVEDKITIVEPPPPNRPPKARPDTYHVRAGTSRAWSAANGVLANDSDPEGAAMIASRQGDSVPSSISLKFRPDGSFALGKVPLDDAGEEFSIHYRAIDPKGDYDNETATIVVDPPPWECGITGFSIVADPHIIGGTYDLHPPLVEWCWNYVDAEIKQPNFDEGLIPMNSTVEVNGLLEWIGLAFEPSMEPNIEVTDRIGDPAELQISPRAVTCVKGVSILIDVLGGRIGNWVLTHVGGLENATIEVIRHLVRTLVGEKEADFIEEWMIETSLEEFAEEVGALDTLHVLDEELTYCFDSVKFYGADIELELGVNGKVDIDVDDKGVLFETSVEVFGQGAP